MTKTQLEKMLLTSTLIRNGCCAAVLFVLAGFMLYELVTPADKRPAVADSAGGIPVVALADAPAQGFPGIPLEVINAVMEDAQKTMAAADSGAKRYVAETVSCNNGVAWVAVKTRDAIEHVSFTPLQNLRDGVTTITCSPAGYQSNGQPLTDIQVAMYAMDSAKQPQ